MYIPLAERLRPKNLNEFIGQTHLVGKSAPIKKVIETKNIYSMIFWGPPGTGKTTLARLIASEINLPIHEFSAVRTGLDDIKKALGINKVNPQLLLDEKVDASKTSILFLDEIHRFNKAQQDFLLPFVESGRVILIGATTENPSFEVISALLSRSKVFTFDPLTDQELINILDTALTKINKGVLKEEVAKRLIQYANGDARKLINTIEYILHQNYKPQEVTTDMLSKILQETHLRYDKKSEEHYNTISAFIKSMRFSDPNATLYYLARMLSAGEDPKFIARRMIVFASEDVGIADNYALTLAVSVKEAIDFVGMPEAQINLSHTAVYLARAKKSRTTYNAYFKALNDVKEHGNLEIPMHLRNAPTKLMKELGYGKGYGKVKENMPNKLKNQKYLANNLNIV